MPNSQYVALLRGINVGGKNLIGMPALKACLEAAAFGNVATYIQSGNVLFEARGERAKLVATLERALSATFHPYDARVVLRSHAELTRIVREAPKGFGREPETYRYDVTYVREPLTAAKAIAVVPTNPDVDRVYAGPGVLYAARLIAKAAQSRLSRVVGLPIYKDLTTRNWNTTTKLLALMDARAGG